MDSEDVFKSLSVDGGLETHKVMCILICMVFPIAPYDSR